MAVQPTRTDRVRCLHCKKAQTKHSRAGLWFNCRYCGKRNPGPAISEAVIAPWGGARRDATSTTSTPEIAPGGEQPAAVQPPPGDASQATSQGDGKPPKRAARVVRRPAGAAVNRPSSTATGGETTATQGQPAARPPVTRRETSSFRRMLERATWG